MTVQGHEYAFNAPLGHVCNAAMNRHSGSNVGIALVSGPELGSRLDCTPSGGHLGDGLLDSLPGELLLEVVRAAVAKGRVQPLGIVDLLDEAR